MGSSLMRGTFLRRGVLKESSAKSDSGAGNRIINGACYFDLPWPTFFAGSSLLL